MLIKWCKLNIIKNSLFNNNLNEYSVNEHNLFLKNVLNRNIECFGFFFFKLDVNDQNKSK